MMEGDFCYERFFVTNLLELNTMERIEKYIYKTENLMTCVQDYEEIVIYGAGDYGRRVVDYLFAMGQASKVKDIVITRKVECDEAYRGIPIRQVDEAFAHDKQVFAMIAVSLPYQEEIAQVLKQFGVSYCYVTEELYLTMGRALDARKIVPYRGIDFLLPGFIKCGTTSLYFVLKQMDDIYLSEKKESHFFQWCDREKDAKGKLIEYYFDNIRENQIVGMIEPSFAKEAARVHALFGDEVKILFMVRNPVEAAFSSFKMHNRLGLGEMENAYRKNGRFCEEMFEAYVAHCMEEETYFAEYVQWIEEYLQYYPENQVKVVIFEELIKEPQRIINDILIYIGSSNRYEEATLPRINEGNFVMADEEGYKIARQVHDWNYNNRTLDRENVQLRYEKQCEYSQIQSQYGKAEKIYGLKMTAEQRGKMEEKFADSVRRLERLIGKDLSQMWF